MGTEMLVVDDPVVNGFETQRRHRALGDINEGIVVQYPRRKSIDLPFQGAAGQHAGIDPSALDAGIIAVPDTEIVLGAETKRQAKAQPNDKRLSHTIKGCDLLRRPGYRLSK